MERFSSPLVCSRTGYCCMWMWFGMAFVPNLNFLRLFDSQIGLQQPKDLGHLCHLQRILDHAEEWQTWSGATIVAKLWLGRRFVGTVFP